MAIGSAVDSLASKLTGFLDSAKTEIATIEAHIAALRAEESALEQRVALLNQKIHRATAILNDSDQ